jgi:co-chaperonin GroES (HSP10)
MEEKIQPLGKRVLLRMSPKEEKRGDLFIPETIARDNVSAVCIVLAVGGDCNSVAVGQAVLIDASTVHDATLGTDDLLIVDEDYLLGVIE